MLCKNCGTENENDMIFCQNCGKSINGSADTPVSNTIKKIAEIFFVLELIFGIIVLLGGIILSATMESAVPFVIGAINGSIIVAFAFLSRAILYGYGIIVGYCERRDER